MVSSFFISYSVFGQNVCGAGISNPNFQQANGFDDCFDIDEIFERCTPIYLNVVVHMFLDDDCNGPLGMEPGAHPNPTKELAYVLAQKLINNANSFYKKMNQNSNELNHQWGQLTHGAIKTDHQFVPIQYVLCDVLIHCDQDAKENTNVGNYPQKFGPYYNATSDVIDIFLHNNLTADGGGFGPLLACATTETMGAGLLNHEIGHYLDLDHTFSPFEICPDTWRKTFEWDYNDDGVIDEFISDQFCWNQNQIDPDPITGVNVNSCDTENTNFDVSHPCCEWINQNNNVMTYSGYANYSGYAALTPCQVEIMVNTIDDNLCDVVNCIDCCPPAKSIVGILPNGTNELDCPTCFHLYASANDVRHNIIIKNVLGTILYSSGWKENPGAKFCLEPIKNISGVYEWPFNLEEGNTYIFELEVMNKCEESDVSDFQFILPTPCSVKPSGKEDKLELLSFSPNPSSSFINIEVRSTEVGAVSFFGVNLITQENYGLLMDGEIINTSNPQMYTLSTTQFDEGVNTIYIRFENELHSFMFIKI